MGGGERRTGEAPPKTVPAAASDDGAPRRADRLEDCVAPTLGRDGSTLGESDGLGGGALAVGVDLREWW